MYWTSFSFIALFFGVVCKSVIGQHLEGESCTVSSSGANGTCKLFSLCPSVIKALRAGIFPTNCGFKVNEPIVCCTDGSIYSSDSLPSRTATISTAEVTSNPTTKYVPTNPSTTTQNVISEEESKSKQKCREYGAYVYQDAAIVPNIGGGPVPKVDNCQAVEVENIVGGTPAKLKEFPHMALIGFDDGNSVTHWDCGGSLISEKFVVTAAHCISHGQYSNAKYVLLGKLVLDSNERSSQKIAIKNTIPHPKYLPPSYYHDIALFELENAAILNSFVRPACLNTNPNLTNRLGIASGWGRTSTSGAVSNALQKVTLEMFTNRECNYTYRRNIGAILERGIVEETQVCAGSRNDSKDTCLGDSGGPLQIINNGEVYCTYKIIGITSFGKSCGQVNFPGVYTKVSAYIKWIEDIVWP